MRIHRRRGLVKRRITATNTTNQLADQIVTMQSPQQLSGQLDELLDVLSMTSPGL